MPASKDAKSIYSVHPGVAMTQKRVAELPAKTGRSLEQWLEFVRRKGPAGEKERREWLKAECGLGTQNASWIAERASGSPLGLADDDPASYLAAAPRYVEAMYSGREVLRPIHDELARRAQRLFPAVRISPCQSIVPLYRQHVFAQIKPATKSRIDLGFALKGHRGKLPARMIDTGGLQKGDRITHRIPLAALAEIDPEVERWLQVAWDLDA